MFLCINELVLNTFFFCRVWPVVFNSNVRSVGQAWPESTFAYSLLIKGNNNLVWAEEKIQLYFDEERTSLVHPRVGLPPRPVALSMTFMTFTISIWGSYVFSNNLLLPSKAALYWGEEQVPSGTGPMGRSTTCWEDSQLVEENWWKWPGRGAPRAPAAAAAMTEMEDNDGTLYGHVSCIPCLYRTLDLPPIDVLSWFTF